LSGLIFRLAEAGAAAGVVVLEPRADHWLIYSLAVRPRYQGRGFGKALLLFGETGTRPHPRRPGEMLVDMAKVLRPAAERGVARKP
jgi:ribosomal protein S18 acetylase RimI-like enzyme